MIHETRHDWGAQPPRRPYTHLADSTGIAVHHLGANARPPRTLRDAIDRLRSTQSYHQGTQGWNDIAYGWLVGAGHIWEGRGWGWVDGADTGRGLVMHSVCWLGDSTAHEVPAADLDAINDVIAEHARRYPRAAAHVVGHGDINATSCPGTRLQGHLASGRIGWHPTRPLDAPPTTAVRSTMHSFINAAGRAETYWVAPDGTLRNQWDQPDGTLSPIGQPLGTYALDTVGAPLQIRTGPRAVHWIPAVATLGPTAVTIVVTGTGDGGQTWEPAITADLRRYLKG